MHHITMARFNERSTLHSVDSPVQTVCFISEYECISMYVAYRIHKVTHHFSLAMTVT